LLFVKLCFIYYVRVLFAPSRQAAHLIAGNLPLFF
jgi:hypothetical protein